MKILSVSGAAALAFALGFAAIGCSQETMSKSEIDAAFKSKPPTDAQRQQMANGMAAGFEAAKQQERDWAKAHPDKVAEVNKARAAAGKPPLGE